MNKTNIAVFSILMLCSALLLTGCVYSAVESKHITTKQYPSGTNSVTDNQPGRTPAPPADSKVPGPITPVPLVVVPSAPAAPAPVPIGGDAVATPPAPVVQPATPPAVVIPPPAVSPAVAGVSPAAKTAKHKKYNYVPKEGIAYSLPMVKLLFTATLTNVTTFGTNVVFVPTGSITNSDVLIITTSGSNTLNGSTILTNGYTHTIIVGSNMLYLPTLSVNTNVKAYSIEVDPVIMADPDQLFTLKPGWDPLSSDSYGITVDPTNNFLQSINATNADQTVQIVEELAKTAALFIGNPLGGLGSLSVPPIPAPAQPMSYPGQIQFMFDPTTKDGADGLDYANTFLASSFFPGADLNQARANSPIQLGASFKGSTVSGSTQRYLEKHAIHEADGVLYRPMLPYVLTVRNQLGAAGTNYLAYLVRSPNAAPIFSLPVNHALLVTATTSISFNNGFLQGVNYSTPSQASALLGLPLTVVGDIFSSVTNLLQLKLNLATGQNSIITQRDNTVTELTALNNATTNLLQSAALLKNFQAGLTNKP